MEIGKILKEAREARGLTLEAVEEETKIRRKYIQALEQEQFQILPGPIYAKAFLKNYAKFLNINVEEILEAYKQQFAVETAPEETVKPTEEKIKGKKPGKPRYWLYLVAAILILGIIASIVYGTRGMWLNRAAANKKEQLKTGEPSPPQGGAQNQLPAGQQPLPGQGDTANVSGVKLFLNVKNNECWVRVVVDGNPAFQGIMSAGQSKEFEGKEKIAFTLGNAGAVEVTVNGQNMGFLGGSGQVIDREFKAPGTQ